MLGVCLRCTLRVHLRALLSLHFSMGSCDEVSLHYVWLLTNFLIPKCLASKRGESGRKPRGCPFKSPGSCFSQWGSNQWWSASVTALLWSEVVICNQNIEPRYLEDKVLLMNSPITTLGDHFIYKISSNLQKYPLEPVLLKPLFWKWGNQFPKRKPFDQNSIAGRDFTAVL